MQLLCMLYHTKTRLKANPALGRQTPKIQKHQSLTCVITMINLLRVYSHHTFHLVPVLFVGSLVLSCTSFPLTAAFPYSLYFMASPRPY